jgi:hypothetical protein
MALNKKILTKVKQKTENDQAMDKFLMDLLEFESEQRGWYKTRYAELLENACIEMEVDANADN